MSPLFLPAAAQRLVELHQVDGPGQPRDDQRALRVVQVTLRDQRAQVTIYSAPVADVGELLKSERSVVLKPKFNVLVGRKLSACRLMAFDSACRTRTSLNGFCGSGLPEFDEMPGG